MTNIFYTENNKGKTVKVEVNVELSECLDDILEELINDNKIDCYCYFKDAKKLNKKDFKKLKKIGVSAFIGIVARMDCKIMLKEFSATDKEIEISKYLFELQ